MTPNAVNVSIAIACLIIGFIAMFSAASARNRWAVFSVGLFIWAIGAIVSISIMDPLL